MTPFVIWLKKEEIDELITFIIRSDSSDKPNNNVIDSGDLKELTEKLVIQNNKLIQLFRKIEPLNPIQKKATQAHGVKQKCNHYKEQFEEMKTHCKVFSQPFLKNSNEHHYQACTDCPVNQIKA